MFHLESVISNVTDSLPSRARACAMQLVMRVNAVSFGKVKVYSREDPADVLQDKSDVPHSEGHACCGCSVKKPSTEI